MAIPGDATVASASVWIIGILCTLAGTAVGLIAGRRLGQGGSQTTQQARLQQAEQQLKEYRLEVNSHFIQTAEHLRQLHESYRAVHNSLARDAQALCDRPGLPPILSVLPDALDSRPATAEQLQDIHPPLDYAPKATPLAPGMLREDFGLDRPASAVTARPAAIDAAFIDDDEHNEDGYTGLSQSKN